MEFTLRPGELTYREIKSLLNDTDTLVLDPSSYANIQTAERTVTQMASENKRVYGINTGFGALANTRIPFAELISLQHKIVLSHAAGTGECLPDHIVRLILLLKINSLARGYSGVRASTIEALIKLFNARLYPSIPAKGSVGASGDLAPLAHLAAVLIGVGTVRHQGTLLSAENALAAIHLKPLVLAPKEGLALINGTQVSTALAIGALIQTENLFSTALLAGALSVDAAKASINSFDERIQQVRGHPSQMRVAKVLRELLTDSQIVASHKNCDKVQDPYSLRCQPQVMGACLAQLTYCQQVLMTEANGVSDNPLVFAEDETILSGGNFHAEPVAFAADAMAVAISEIGALSERRIMLLTDAHFSGLPPFLVKNAGINSGFMVAQVTACALASENKSLAHPASVDSLPTSANQEDHVSMATFASRRLFAMIENSITIIGIELLSACQGIDFLRPLTSSPSLETIHALIRSHIPFYEEDRYFSPDIEKIKNLIETGKIKNDLIAF